MNYKKKFKKISHFLYFFHSAMRNLLACFTILVVVVHCAAQRTPVKKVFRYTKEDSKKLLEQFAEIMDSDEIASDSDIPYFGSIPSLVFDLKENKTVRYSDKKFNYTFTASLEKDKIVIDYEVRHLCTFPSSTFLFFLPERVLTHTFHIDGNYQLVFDGITDVERSYYLNNGINVYTIRYGITEMLFDIKRLIVMFTPMLLKKISPNAKKENIKFLQTVANYTLSPRNATAIFPIDAKDVHSGDLFGSLKADGVGPLICAITGSRFSHIEIAVEIDGVMNVCESQDSPFWPIHGWQCNPFDEFAKLVKEGVSNFVHLRLAEPYRSKFDPKRAYNFIKPHLGNVYGYETFVFSAIDTKDKNFFPPIDEGSLDLGYYFLDWVSKDKSNLVLGQGLSNRLSLPLNSTRIDIYRKMVEKKLRLVDVYILPELDEYRYGEDKHIARVLRASGAFEDTEYDVPFNAAEQTPKDIAAMKIWDLTSPLPHKCVENDPDLPYCQIWGDLRLQLDERTVNSVGGCPHMNEACPTVAPLFERPEKC